MKFAKYNPFADENDLSLVNAYLFVNQTKLEEVQPTDGQKTAETATTSSETKDNNNPNGQKI